MNLLEKIRKKNTNYVLENRHWISVKRHVPVVAKAAISGAVCSLIQYYLSRRGIFFQTEAKEAILFLSMAFSFFIYVIFAGYAINRVLDESKEVSRAIIQNDVDTFLLYRDEQLPILIHLPLIIVSGVIIFFLLLFPYPDEFIAIASVFAIVFMMSLLFIVTQELDNYENSIWFKAKTPAEWWQIDIEKHFQNKSKTQ